VTPARSTFVLPVTSADNPEVILHRTDTIALAPTADARPVATAAVLDYCTPPVLAPRESTLPRIIGFDLARALAILGMLVEHCCQVFGPKAPVGFGAIFLRFTDGRASAVFVVLAGAGVSLLGRGHDRAEVRATLFRRGSLLFLLGMLNRMIYPGDILRLFGVTMMAAGVLNALRRKHLLAIAAACVLVFPALYFAGLYVPFLDYNLHWDDYNPVYHDPWSLDGTIRSLFYNGFRPVFPWAGLLIFGMWLGRLDVRRPAVRGKLILWGLGIMTFAEVLSRVGLRLWLAYPLGVSAETIRDVLDEGSMPPMPPFVLAVTGMAMLIIGLCLAIGARWPQWRALRALSATGQMALTWYILHILIGAAIVHYYGWHYVGGSIRVGVTLGLLSFGVIVVASAYWRRYFKYGPLEYLLRAVS
jgi:uncharacterized protein